MNDKIHIGLVSNDIIGKQMAGPGIRYFEMAKALSKKFLVTLFVPNSCDLEEEGFIIKTYDPKKSSSSIGSQISGVDFVLAQSLRPPLMYKIKKLGIKFIADLYDPLTIETLEYTKFDSKRTQDNTFLFNHATLILQLHAADHILCASDRQRDYYLGVMSGEKIIDPKIYKVSPNFSELISLAPFGLSSEPPKIENDLIAEKFPNIKKTDHIIYWGGGLWDWFDPLSVVKAIESISKKRDDIKLVFVGMRHPNPKIKEMKTAQVTLDYCREHNLLDKTVFFNFGWLPFAERANFLKRSSIGISTHQDNLETRFSFRTRILDYFWAELPIVSTKGDSMAELIERENLGITVEYNNHKEIETAIEKLIDDRKLYESCLKNLTKVKTRFYWNNIIDEFSSKIVENQIQTRKISSFKLLKLTVYFYFTGLKKKLFK